MKHIKFHSAIRGRQRRPKYWLTRRRSSLKYLTLRIHFRVAYYPFLMISKETLNMTLTIQKASHQMHVKLLSTSRKHGAFGRLQFYLGYYIFYRRRQSFIKFGSNLKRNVGSKIRTMYTLRARKCSPPPVVRSNLS